MSHKSVRLQASPRGGNGSFLHLFLSIRVHNGNVNISYPENKPHFKDVVGGALLGGGLAYLSHSFLLARQSGPVTSATSTTSLLAMSTSRLYSREDLSVP